MKAVYTAIVKLRKPVIILCLIGVALSALAYTMVKVDYDINDYLPQSAPSSIAIDVMEEEFDGGIPNVRVMVRNVTVPEALEYKELLKAVDGVEEVTWLDDSVSLETPLSSIDPDTMETYYKDGNALFSVAVRDAKRVEAIDAIRGLAGTDSAIYGSAALTAYATTSTVDEIMVIFIFAVAFITLVLILTTESWFEPLIIMISLGVAIIINQGTNLIFGTISFVSNAAGGVLQMGVSLDYAVFLIHRFQECRRETADPAEAMVDALCKSTISILSSGLTTVIGFLALCLMQFLIGPDLGLVLAKGVAISLLTTFILTPCLVVETYKIIDRTRHRPLFPELPGFGKFVRKAMIPFVILFAVIIIPAYLASNSNEYYYGAGHMFDDDVKIVQDGRDIEDIFGKTDTYVLLVPRGDKVTEKEMSEEIADLSQVTDIISYADTVGVTVPEAYLDEDTLSLLESDDYSRLVISVKADYEGDETFALVENIRSIAEKYYPEYHLAGQGVSTYDLMDTVTKDMAKVNLIAIGAVLVILMILTRKLLLPFILVIAIEGAIWINLSIPYFTGNKVYYIAYLIISSVQLGATVDYAILISDRYREYRVSMDKTQALEKTISTCTISVMTSALVLSFVGFTMSIVSSNRLLGQLGQFLGIGTLCSLAVVLLVLPGLLYLLDRLFVSKPKKGRLKSSDDSVKTEMQTSQENEINETVPDAGPEDTEAAVNENTAKQAAVSGSAAKQAAVDEYGGKQAAVNENTGKQAAIK